MALSMKSGNTVPLESMPSRPMSQDMEQWESKAPGRGALDKKEVCGGDESSDPMITDSGTVPGGWIK